MAAVEVTDLRKEFVRKDGRKRTRVAALQGITFAMARGECIAILGQNGSGKSTLVRLLSTLLLPDGGTATVFGHDAFKDTRAVRRLVNRVSVEASFFKKMSAVENLSYAARFYGLRPHETKDKIPEILTRVGFPADRRDEPMENLSRGMQQKVALARALLTAPILLLLDEPTTGLDPRSKQEVQEFIREVRAEHDATVDGFGEDARNLESADENIVRRSSCAKQMGGRRYVSASWNRAYPARIRSSFVRTGLGDFGSDVAAGRPYRDRLHRCPQHHPRGSDARLRQHARPAGGGCHRAQHRAGRCRDC